MRGSQNYGPFLGTLNIRCRIIVGIQKGPIILTTTQMSANEAVFGFTLLETSGLKDLEQGKHNSDASTTS